MRVQRFSFVKALALGLPVLLAGCGDKKPVDPCRTIEKKVKDNTVAAARERAVKLVIRRKKGLQKQFDGRLSFEEPQYKCYMPDAPAPAAAPAAEKKEGGMDKPVPFAKKKRTKPLKAICEITLKYCDRG